MNADHLIKEFQKIYGAEAGMRICTTVMPGIIADFSKMLARERTGREISEEYILEDGKAVLKLKGRTSENGIPDISAVLTAPDR